MLKAGNILSEIFPASGELRAELLMRPGVITGSLSLLGGLLGYKIGKPLCDAFGVPQLRKRVALTAALGGCTAGVWVEKFMLGHF